MEENMDELFSPPGFVFVLTVTAVVSVVGLMVWGMVVLIFNSGPLFCSDSGGDYYTRPAASAYLPEIAVCLIATVLLAAILQAAVGVRWALALAASSIGSILGYLTLAHYLSHANQPATYECGAAYLYPGTSMPAYAAPVLLIVYVLVLLSCRSAVRRKRIKAA
jgi:hypothetical protein